tara:strand:+ start:6222 stop:7151 length:930 start_codon:yes stop_codon:yes gene_type:complete
MEEDILDTLVQLSDYINEGVNHEVYLQILVENYLEDNINFNEALRVFKDYMSTQGITPESYHKVIVVMNDLSDMFFPREEIDEELLGGNMIGGNCKKQRTIFNKKKNNPNYIAIDCYGSVMRGTDGKAYISVEKKSGIFDMQWKEYKEYKNTDVVEKPDKVNSACNKFKYLPGGWRNDLLSPPYDPLDCKGLKLIGNDGNLWISTPVGKNVPSAPAYWKLVLKKAPKKAPKKVTKKVIKKVTKKAPKKTTKKTTKKSKKKTIKKSREGRPSPPLSAKNFKLGTKKRGGDGNMWIIVENKNKVKRWKKVN